MTIYDQQLAEGRVYGRLAVRQRNLAFAREGIEIMRAVAPRSYVSLSFGKQSLVLAHMIFQVAPDTPMWFLASGESWIMHDYANVIEAFLGRWPINLHIKQTEHFFDDTITDWQASRDAGQTDLQTMCDRADWDGWYWGLAKEESRIRRITLGTRTPGSPHPTIYRYVDDKYRCCPLMNWGILDLAAYIAEYDLPMLSLYHRAGLTARTTARLTRKAATWGGLTALQHYDISVFNQLCQRFPELHGVDRHQ